MQSHDFSTLKMIEVPEPRRMPLRIFGINAFLQERTKENRRGIELAFAEKNGTDTDVLDYALTFAVIESALICNLRSPLKIHFLKWYHPVRWNTLFSSGYLRNRLTESQIMFLVDEINKLDFGEYYEEVKKKIKQMSPKPAQSSATK